MPRLREKDFEGAIRLSRYMDKSIGHGGLVLVVDTRARESNLTEQ